MATLKAPHDWLAERWEELHGPIAWVGFEYGKADVALFFLEATAEAGAGSQRRVVGFDGCVSL